MEVEFDDGYYCNNENVKVRLSTMKIHQDTISRHIATPVECELDLTLESNTKGIVVNSRRNQQFKRCWNARTRVS